MGRGDVICVQEGERGCYTASHWWNLHAAFREAYEASHGDLRQQNIGYNPSTVFFGSSSSPLSSHPRVVCVDAKGSVRRELRDRGIDLWDGAVHDVTGPACGPRVGSGVNGVRKEYFGDFMDVLSDQTKIHVISTIQRWGPEEQAWSVHGARCPVHQDELESIEDSVRILAEKSDTLAGFMVMADDRSVWGNVASCLLEEMRDDYRGKSTFLFATRREDGEGNDGVAADGPRGKSQTAKSLLEGLAVASLAPLVDLYVPLQGHGGTLDKMFESTLAAAMGIFGATIPFMMRDEAQWIDMASIASSLCAGHQRCPLAALDVFSPVFSSPLALSGHARSDDVNRITEYVSILGGNGPGGIESVDRDPCSWFDMDAVSLSRPSTKIVHRTGTGVPVLRSMREAPIFKLEHADRTSIRCATVLGSTSAFVPRLRSLAWSFTPPQVREQAALLESWGVHGLCEEVHEELLSMADCFFD